MHTCTYIPLLYSSPFKKMETNPLQGSSREVYLNHDYVTTMYLPS